MAETHKTGLFNWVDVATTDSAAGKSFYQRLFGWTSQDIPGEDGPYTIFQSGEKSVAALHPLGHECQQPHWLLYVSCDNCDETAEKIKAHGGQVHAGPLDAMEAGRMAVVADPTGAAFALWQPRKHSGAGLVNEIGSMSWHELLSTDPDRSGAFYAAVFGWTIDTQNMHGMQYHMLMKEGAKVGGMMATPSSVPAGTPSFWTVYFTVADCDASFQTVKDLGGASVMGPMAMPGLGKFGVVQDGQGAKFGLIAYEKQ